VVNINTVFALFSLKKESTYNIHSRALNSYKAYTVIETHLTFPNKF